MSRRAFPDPTSVKFGSVDSDDPTSGFVDVVLPVQSFFQNVPHSVEVVSSDQSVAAFLQLEPTFVGVGTSDSPWDSADFFGRAEIPIEHAIAVKI